MKIIDSVVYFAKSISLPRFISPHYEKRSCLRVYVYYGPTCAFRKIIHILFSRVHSYKLP